MHKVSRRWQEISGPQDAPNLGNKCPNELERRSKPQAATPLTFVTVAAGGMINQWTILYELLSSTGGVSWMSLGKLSKSLPGCAWLLLSYLPTTVAAEFGQGASRIWRDLYCTAATVTRLLFHVGRRRKTMVRGIHSTNRNGTFVKKHVSLIKVRVRIISPQYVVLGYGDTRRKTLRLRCQSIHFWCAVTSPPFSLRLHQGDTSER